MFGYQHCKISKAEFLRASMPSCHVIGWRCPFDCAATRAQACCHSCELPMHDNKEVNLGRPMLSSTNQGKNSNVCALPKPNLHSKHSMIVAWIASWKIVLVPIDNPPKLLVVFSPYIQIDRKLIILHVHLRCLQCTHRNTKTGSINQLYHQHCKMLQQLSRTAAPVTDIEQRQCIGPHMVLLGCAHFVVKANGNLPLHSHATDLTHPAEWNSPGCYQLIKKYTNK